MAPAITTESKRLDISKLMSPPDPVIDSFSQQTSSTSTSSNSTASVSAGAVSSQKHPLPMSPPISPLVTLAPTTDAPTTPPSQTIKDPVLYPNEDAPATLSPPQPPLFATWAELDNYRSIVNDHVRFRTPGTFGRASPPAHDEYMLVLSFRSAILKPYMANRRGWLLKEREYLKADRRAANGANGKRFSGAGNGAQRYPAIMPAKSIVAKPHRAQRTDRVSKPQPAPRAVRSGNGTAVASTPASNSTIIHAGSPPARTTVRVSATPEPSRRSVAPNREDKDFHSLPDYCPPLSSLPNRPNSLKVDWKGQPIDLSNDPHAHLLHPDEVTLAGNLRLDCATYLTSKRRIFVRRLECLGSGKEFRKTDAQQACKIDVNKASKLWTAFDKVGWLDAKWVDKFR
jgi:hypothetical protein